MRVGLGYDVHKLVEDRKLIIGGVEIPYEKGLLGHSDADVLLHAIMDALLGAAALGDALFERPVRQKARGGIGAALYVPKLCGRTDALCGTSPDAPIVAEISGSCPGHGKPPPALQRNPVIAGAAGNPGRYAGAAPQPSTAHSTRGECPGTASGGL